MRNFILLSFALLPAFLFSQNADSSSTKKLSFGFIFSPDYCYRTIKTDSTYNDKSIVSGRDTLEIPKIGFTIGATLRYQCCKRFEFATGLFFSNQGEKQKEVMLTYSTPDPSLPSSFKMNYCYQYLEIPLNLNFSVLEKKKFRFTLCTGISANIYLKTKYIQTLIYSSGYEKTTSAHGNDAFSAINPAMDFGLGIQYKINSKISIGLQPVYRRSIIPIKNAPIKQWNYSYGMICGIYFACK